MKFLGSLIFSLLVVYGCVTNDDYEQNRHEQSAEALDLESDYSTLRRQVSNRRIVTPLLWQVSKDDKTSYLFGTIHMGVRLGQLPRHIVRKMHGSRTIVLENDQRELSGNPISQFSQKYADHIYLPKDQKLRDMIGEEAFKLLSEKLALGDTTLDQMTPRAAQGFLELYAFFQSMRNLPKGMLDLEIAQLADNQNIQLVALEGSEQSLELLKVVLGLDSEKKNNEEAVEFKQFLLEESSEFEKQLNNTLFEMIYAYKSGDMQRIKEISDREFKVLPGISKVLLDQRNQEWMRILKKEFDQGGAFVAVGALHMTGSKSLVSMLTDAGYTVSRIND